MSRQILCFQCGTAALAGQLHDSEQRDGWTSRGVYLSNSRVPGGHGIAVNGDFTPVSDIHCDLCNEVITGKIVVAISRIPPGKVMREWETDYGKVMSAEEVEAYCKLAKI